MSLRNTGRLRKDGRQSKNRVAVRQGISTATQKLPYLQENTRHGGQWVELTLVNQIREQMKDWRKKNYPGVTGTTLELLKYWQREGRQHRLFFAQIEAAETVIFLSEARADYLQGIDIPLDDISNERKAEGYAAFKRYACKMATGAGKTTVMGMFAAWSILNKVNDRSDGRFSDVVLVICPNVTIRNRLQELDPARGEASLYRTRSCSSASYVRPDQRPGAGKKLACLRTAGDSGRRSERQSQ